MFSVGGESNILDQKVKVSWISKQNISKELSSLAVVTVDSSGACIWKIGLQSPKGLIFQIYFTFLLQIWNFVLLGLPLIFFLPLRAG